MEFVIPSKTFLIGEYLALHQGPALVVATHPYFAMLVKPTHHKMIEDKSLVINSVSDHEFAAHGIHPQSPAGRLLADHQHLFENMTVCFDDPHHGQGGFGASGAQFLGVYQAILKISHQDFDLDHLAALYRRYHDSGSGADIIAQLYGQITLFHSLDKLPDIMAWPFENLGFMLVRTGFKISTHDHLESSFDHLPFDAMHAFVWQAVNALKEKNELSFIQAIQNYGDLLQKLNLLYEPVKPLIQSWQQLDGVMAVKGCGAMGADVLLVLYKKDVFIDHDYDYVACDGDLIEGSHEL